MFFFNRNARALAHAQQQWIGLAYKTPNKKLAQQVRSHLSAYQKFKVDGDILIIKNGLASIAIHADHAVTIRGHKITPGVNHKGERGFLVLDSRTAPFYSLAPSAGEALTEARQSKTRQKLQFSPA